MQKGSSHEYRPGLKRVAVALGSNRGDRFAMLRFGIERLSWVLEEPRASSVYETVPVHYDAQALFLNACCVGRTALTAQQLLSAMQDAERSAGRSSGGPKFGPRELDLDLLLYEELILVTEHLVIPHPRLRERAFVLVPLAEIAPDWKVPATPEREAAMVAQLAGAVDRTGISRTELEL